MSPGALTSAALALANGLLGYSLALGHEPEHAPAWVLSSTGVAVSQMAATALLGRGRDRIVALGRVHDRGRDRVVAHWVLAAGTVCALGMAATGRTWLASLLGLLVVSATVQVRTYTVSSSLQYAQNQRFWADQTRANAAATVALLLLALTGTLGFLGLAASRLLLALVLWVQWRAHLAGRRTRRLWSRKTVAYAQRLVGAGTQGGLVRAWPLTSEGMAGTLAASAMALCLGRQIDGLIIAISPYINAFQTLYRQIINPLDVRGADATGQRRLITAAYGLGVLLLAGGACVWTGIGAGLVPAVLREAPGQTLWCVLAAAVGLMLVPSQRQLDSLPDRCVRRLAAIHVGCLTVGWMGSAGLALAWSRLSVVAFVVHGLAMWTAWRLASPARPAGAS